MSSKPRRNIHGDVRCAACDQYLNPDQFRVKGRGVKGQVLYEAYCHSCMRAYHRERVKAIYRTNPRYRAQTLARGKQRWQDDKRRIAFEAADRAALSRRVVATLRDRGWSMAAIAEASGASLSTLYQLVAYPDRLPRRETTERLTALYRRVIDPAPFTAHTERKAA